MSATKDPEVKRLVSKMTADVIKLIRTQNNGREMVLERHTAAMNQLCDNDKERNILNDLVETANKNYLEKENSTQPRATAAKPRAAATKPRAAAFAAGGDDSDDEIMTDNYTSEQNDLYSEWFQSEQMQAAPLEGATAIVGDDFQERVNPIIHFACKVANNGKWGETKIKKEDWKEMFNLPFVRLVSLLDGMGGRMMHYSSLDETSPFHEEKLGTTFRQFAIDLVVTDPTVILGYNPNSIEEKKSNGQIAYEAAVELLGCRKPH
jgi:hypothetical protein